MRWIPLLAALTVWTAPALAAPVTLGEPAPALEVDGWLPAAPDPAEGPTLVLFVATWCAASRALLDHLETEDGGVPLRVVAVDERERVQRFASVGGWQRSALGADPGGAVWRAWFGDDGDAVPLPHAFVLDREPGGDVLWHGPALRADAEAPLAALEAVLDRVLAGEWDLDPAVETALASAPPPGPEEDVAAPDVPVEPASPAAPPPPWSGVINQAFSAVGEDRLVLVHPSGEAWAAEMDDLQRAFFGDSSFRVASDFDPTAHPDHVVILYGTPTDNALVGEILTHHGITLDGDGIHLRGRTVAAVEPYLVAALSSPWQPDLPVVVYTASSETGARGLNGVFHGPTAVVIGTQQEGVRENVVEADLRIEDGRVVDLALGPASLTPGQVSEDLRALATLLHREYAGYDDVAWTLRAGGPRGRNARPPSRRARRSCPRGPSTTTSRCWWSTWIRSRTPTSGWTAPP
jgi:thiol-disulfide isomerase/thioredoxin